MREITHAGRTPFKGYLKPPSNPISSPHSYTLPTKAKGHVFADDDKKGKPVQGTLIPFRLFGP